MLTRFENETNVTMLPSWSASPDGGDTVEIVGANFGPTEDRWGGEIFLDEVTYGPFENTRSFKAYSCKVVDASVRIRCKMTHGVGTNLYWRVTVKEQSSIAIRKLSPTLSYAKPHLASVRLDQIGVPFSPPPFLSFGNNPHGPQNVL